VTAPLLLLEAPAAAPLLLIPDTWKMPAAAAALLRAPLLLLAPVWLLALLAVVLAATEAPLVLVPLLLVLLAPTRKAFFLLLTPATTRSCGEEGQEGGQGDREQQPAGHLVNTCRRRSWAFTQHTVTVNITAV
jgi:hypothetical protein